MTVSAAVEGFEVEVRREEGGSVLTVMGERGGFELRSDDGAFWTAELRDEHGGQAVLDGADASVETAVDRTGDAVVVEIVWRNEPVDLHETDGTATTTLHGRVRAGDPTVRWSARVSVTGVDATLVSFALPAVDDVRRLGGDRGDAHLVLPDGWGLDVADPLAHPERATLDAARYPGATCTMQFVALVNEGAGLYLAAHDPQGQPKTVTTTPDGDAGRIPVEVEHHPAGATGPTGTFELPYEVAFGTFEGDWYDAAVRYRRWVLDAADWTRPGPLSDREDLPGWLRERCLWWLLAPRATDHARDRALLERLGETFPVPSAVHWYTWHRGPFDVDYPDYFPSRAGWADAVAALEAADVRAIPYVNARIADPNSEAWRERDLATAAARDASARLDSAHRPLRYETYDDQAMVAMCPATDRWRETVVDVVDRLADGPASGVYLDQLAAYAPPLCFARGHDHPPGGGAYGVDGYRDLLATVRERTDEAFAVTAENNAEPYLDLLDGVLLWNSARSDLVPLFDAVYGDHVLAFGRQHFAADLDHDGAFRSKVAQAIAFGAQPGWVRHGVAERLLEDGHEVERRYLRDAVETLDARGGVHTGRRLRDPAVRDVPSRSVRWELYRHGRWDVDLQAVLAGLWRPDAASGRGTVASLLVTNWTDGDRVATVTLPNDQVPPDDVASVRTRGSDAVDVGPPTDGTDGPDADDGADGPVPADGELRVRLPACTTAVLELRGSE